MFKFFYFLYDIINLMENNSPQQKRQYGILSMISIIVGTVIGSGIFIKNQSLMEGTQSALLCIVGWIIAGLVVLSMMLAFVEISSISKLKNEQGTFKNWSNYLLGPKISKFIGGYFTFLYFPLVLGSETIFASQEIFGLNKDINWLVLWIGITIVSIIIITLAFIINTRWKKPGQVISTSGVFLKLVPLFSVILIGFLVVIGVSVGNIDKNHIFDPSADINVGINDGFNLGSFGNILIILPGILFAFDGFLYANSMSNETKTKNTFKHAIIISVVIITLIYILFSLTSYMIADVEIKDGKIVSENFGITEILKRVFGNVIGIIMTIIIFISIIVVTFNYVTISMWAMADYSETNDLRDVNGTFIKRNKSGNPDKAGIRMFVFVLIALAIFRIADLITLISISQGIGIEDISLYSTSITSYGSDLYTVTNFGLYALIIFGSLKNRVTKEQEVEKIGGFWFFAILSLVVMFGVAGYMMFDIVHTIFKPFFSSKGIDVDFILSINKVVFLIMYISSMIAVFVFLSKEIKPLSDEEKEYKDLIRLAYVKHIPFYEFSEYAIKGDSTKIKEANKKIKEYLKRN